MPIDGMLTPRAAVDAGATAEAGSMVPEAAQTNPGGKSDMPKE